MAGIERLVEGGVQQDCARPNGVEYKVAVEELRKYKLQLTAWVERNEPER